MTMQAIQFRPGPGGNCREVTEFVGGAGIPEHECGFDCTPTNTFVLYPSRGEGGYRFVQPGQYVVQMGAHFVIAPAWAVDSAWEIKKVGA